MPSIGAVCTSAEMVSLIGRWPTSLAGSDGGSSVAPRATGGLVPGTRVTVSPGSGAPNAGPYSATLPAPSTTVMPSTAQLSVCR